MRFLVVRVLAGRFQYACEVFTVCQCLEVTRIDITYYLKELRRLFMGVKVRNSKYLKCCVVSFT